MGLVTLQVIVHSEIEPCKVSDHDTHDGVPWEVAIMTCDGKALNYCKTNYVGIPAPCGIAEIKVPPGCYIVRGGENLRIGNHGGVLGNHMTDHAIVIACCDDDVCVHLFAPTLHNCVFGVTAALNEAIAVKKVPADLGKNALTALKAIHERLPKSDFDVAAIPVMEELLKGVNTRKKK
jgi:hypothetical protein